jgi:hypothetical protein
MNTSLRFIVLAGLMIVPARAQQPPGLAPAPPSLTPAPMDAEVEFSERLEARKKKQLEAKWNIRVDVMMVSLPLDRALQLLPDLQTEDDRKVEGAFTQILDLIAKRQATLFGWPSLVTLDGQRAVMETIVEKRYPTEFSPPITPSNPGASFVDQGLNSALPASFETRNTGTTLEVEATVLDDGKRIHVDLVPQRVALIGWKTYKVGKKEVGLVDIDQPEFATEKVTTSMSLRNGARILIATHRLESPADQMEFFILHVKATPVK